MDRNESTDMRENRDIGEYRIVRLLGKGGMSEVYEAEHSRLGSRHAIKLFSYDKDVDGVRERFLAEGKLLARLSHPRVVRVTDAGMDAETGRPYFVMDLVADPEGAVRSLADIPSGEADESRIAMWYEDLRDGLAYIHGKGVIHRDLKLENILIGPDGHVVMADFGISKIDASTEEGAAINPVHTIMRLKDGKGLLMGSHGYMAPELEMGVAASPASDYYALGVIVFRLLTGTWYDAHTDVLGSLETYDPAWRQILPKLLHSNVRGRECLSWRELKEAQDDRLEIALETERASARRGRLCLWIVSAALLVSAVAAVAFGLRLALPEKSEPPPALPEKSEPPPMFEDIVFVPQDAPEEATEEEETEGAEEATDSRCSREELEAALPDAWWLVHGVFVDLRNGWISYEKAISTIADFAKRAHEDENLFFNDDVYEAKGDNKALYELLNAAAKRMEERYLKK